MLKPREGRNSLGVGVFRPVRDAEWPQDGRVEADALVVVGRMYFEVVDYVLRPVPSLSGHGSESPASNLTGLDGANE